MKYTAYGLVVASALLGQAAYADEWASLATRTTIENDRICYSDATDIICDSNAPTLTDINSLVSSGGGLWTATGSDIYFTGGKVGIGITAPAAPLHVRSDNSYLARLSVGTDVSGAVNTSGLELYNEYYDVGGKIVFDYFGTETSGGHGMNYYAGRNGFANHWFREEDGTLQMVLKDGGNVGVGTATPSERLAVAGNVKLDASAPYINFGDKNTIYATSGDKLYFTDGGPGAGVQLMIDNSTYRVGIGTTAPGSKLDVAGTIRAQELCDETGANCTDLSAGIGGSVTADSLNFTELADSLILDATTDIATLTNDLTVNTDDFVIDGATGNVGIGTAAPDYPLTVNGRGDFSGLVRSTNESGVSFSAAGAQLGKSTGAAGALHYTYPNMVMTASSGFGLLLQANGADAVQIDTDGNVGIGTTSPTGILDVNVASVDAVFNGGGGKGTTSFGGANIEFDRDNNTYLANSNSGTSAKLILGVGSATSADIVINQDGNVGIGTTIPDSTLHIFDAASDATISLAKTAIPERRLNLGYGSILMTSSDDLIIGTQGTNVINIDGDATPVVNTISVTAGRVGIGTPAPAADTKLDVAGAIKIAATETETCAATEDLGKIRFNSTLGKFQICRP